MSAPALLVAIPLLVGVVAGALSGTGARGGWIVLAIAWVMAAIGLWRGARVVTVLATFAGCLSAGTALGARAALASANPSLLTWFNASPPRDRPVRMTAELREDATPRLGSAQAPQVVSVTVAVREIDGLALDGGVRVTIAGALAGGVRREWRAGRTIDMTVVLREPLDYR